MEAMNLFYSLILFMSALGCMGVCIGFGGLV